jgi:hypothetical protein
MLRRDRLQRGRMKHSHLAETDHQKSHAVF